MERDYYSDDFDMNGDLLDDVLIDDFGLSPKYTTYWTLRKIVYFALEKELIINYDNICSLYAEENDIEYDFLIQSINRLFTSSTKRLIKKGVSHNTFCMIIERYKARKEKKNGKRTTN